LGIAVLLNLTEAKAFEPIWSDDIHAEWMRNLLSSMGIPIDKIEYRRGEMERAFSAANVPGSPTLIATIQGVSKTAARGKDAHVVATAVIAKAAVIVTHNIKDFSPEVLNRYGVAIIVRPDAFCPGLLASHETQVLAGIRKHRANLRRPPMSPAQYIGHLPEARLDMPGLALALASLGRAI
jgi:PIN domain